MNTCKQLQLQITILKMIYEQLFSFKYFCIIPIISKWIYLTYRLELDGYIVTNA